MPAARASSPPLPALPIPPIVPTIPAPIDAVFHPCVVAQRTTTDLIIYSRDLGRIVTIAYPLGPIGARIVPSGMFNWMERRGLVLECFCALVSGQPTPARFVNEFLSRHTVVRCHHLDNRCGFYLDLTKIHMMTMLESGYEHIPTLPFGNPDFQAVISRWHRMVARDPTLLQHPAPYIDGYLGIHVSMYPGITQLRSGQQQPLTFTSHRRHTPYHPYRNRRTSFSPNHRTISQPSTPNQSPHRRVSVGGSPLNETGHAPVATPSRLMGEELSEREVDALSAMRLGFGISRDDAESLFEECDHCGRTYIRSALRVHIKQVHAESTTETGGMDAMTSSVENN